MFGNFCKVDTMQEKDVRDKIGNLSTLGLECYLQLFTFVVKQCLHIVDISCYGCSRLETTDGTDSHGYHALY